MYFKICQVTQYKVETCKPHQHVHSFDDIHVSKFKFIEMLRNNEAIV